MNWAVIMAGGSGTRFWPLSRIRRPKQLQTILGGKAMIQQTVERLQPLVPLERILIVTHRLQKSAIRKLLHSLPPENILEEPCSRNTAPCLGWAALHLEKRDPEAVFASLPADHHIQDSRVFQKHLRLAFEIAAQNKQVLFGIPPAWPHTGFGYISRGEKMISKQGINVYRGQRFIEKPSLKKAGAFLRSGNYFWNSGMFVWKVPFFLNIFEKNLPALSRKLFRLRRLTRGEERNYIRRIFPTLPSVSIDYGLMEKAGDLYVIKARFNWSDVGNWSELGRLLGKDRNGNVLSGKVISLASQHNIVKGRDRLIAILGVDNLIVVDTQDALLICGKDHAQAVKNLVGEISRRKWNRYL